MVATRGGGRCGGAHTGACLLCCVCVCRQLVCEGRSKKLKVYRKAPEAPGKVENVGGVVSVDREGAAGNSIAAGLTLFCELE